MVELNTSKTTRQPQPINLYRKEKKFFIVGKWLSKRKEIRAKGYRDYYGFIQATCGDQGYCFIKNETIAEALGSCVRTIQHYHSLSQKYNLIQIVPAPRGRASLFVPSHHPWMGLSEDQAAELRPELPVSINALLNKHCRSGVQSFQTEALQVTENKQDIELLEISSINHVEEIRSMHAGEVAGTNNITNRNIAEEKETRNTINANNTTSVSKDSERQQILSVYSLEICKQYALAYAKAKLMTNDEIRDTRAFALYCLRSGEKDAWINAFIENGYVLAPVNPLKGQEVEESQQKKIKKISPEKTRQIKEQANENTELKGKHSYQVYLDFVNYELKQGKAIDSVERLASWLQRTGTQDETQVKQFIELMNSTYLGSKVPQTNAEPANIELEAEFVDEIKDLNTANQVALPSVAQEEAFQIQRLLAIESLGQQAWVAIEKPHQELLLEKAKLHLSQNNKFFNTWRLEGQDKHAVGIIKEKLGNYAYKANVSDCGGILEKIGKEIFEGLDEDLQGELVGEKIELAGDEFYLSSKQGKLMEGMRREIYVELGIGEAGRE